MADPVAAAQSDRDKKANKRKREHAEDDAEANADAPAAVKAPVAKANPTTVASANLPESDVSGAKTEKKTKVKKNRTPATVDEILTSATVVLAANPPTTASDEFKPKRSKAAAKEGKDGKSAPVATETTKKIKSGKSDKPQQQFFEPSTTTASTPAAVKVPAAAAPGVQAVLKLKSAPKSAPNTTPRVAQVQAASQSSDSPVRSILKVKSPFRVSNAKKCMRQPQKGVVSSLIVVQHRSRAGWRPSGQMASRQTTVK